MKNDRLNRSEAGLLVIDVQEKLVKLVEHSTEILCSMQKAIKGCQLLGLPIVITEQYPQGLGGTLPGLMSYFGDNPRVFHKTTFSCMQDPTIKQAILDLPVKQWIVIGIEAHVCVLQSAKDLLAAGKQVIVLNDAISSRSIYDFSTAIAEMRDCGARITSLETVLFELLHDSKDPSFKAISQLIK